MAQCKKTCSSFIRDAFSPVVGVVCSNEVNALCQKNHLAFAELVLPFSRLTSSVHIRDASGTSHSLERFSLVFRDGLVPPPQSTLATRLLGDAVGQCHPKQREKLISLKGYDINIASSTPWYEEYRDTFLSVAVPSDHEYLKHFVACVFVVSSSSADPMSEFAKLGIDQHQQQQQFPSKLPKWFTLDLLRYYVLLHDCVDGEDTKAEAVYQSMKAKYGVHSCHLLKINSISPNPESPVDASLPDPWSNFIKNHTPELSKSADSVETGSQAQETPNGHVPGAAPEHPLEHPLGSPKSPKFIRPRALSQSGRGGCLSATDHDRLRIFIHEFIVRALIPWAERLIKTFNELYQSKKKGGFLKNLFGNRTRPGEKTVSVYAQESTEMQLRRLADLYFLFQMYEHAYTVYHSLKKDFESDKAWMFCAGAQEMAGLSIFMQGSSAQRTYPTHYLDGAIGVYHTCKSQQFMTRAVLMSTEVLKEKGLWLQAASQFLKLTGEESDLRSAVLLEQAAHCYLNMNPGQIRKYAFHMVLAGNRYAKSSQRKHSVRCYELASQIYHKLGWSLAEDHIGITTSRLSAQLSDNVTALSKLCVLLSDNTESPAQQSTFFREYLALYETVKVEHGEDVLPDLHIPAVVKNEIIVTTDYYEDVTSSYVYSDDVRWLELEDACVIASRGVIPFNMQRSVPSYSKLTKNSQPPNSIINETQYIRIMLHNPLKISIQLSNLSLVWQFKKDGEDTYKLSSQISNPSSILEQQVVKVLDIDGLKRMWVLFRFIPKALGMLQILSLSYKLGEKADKPNSTNVSGKQMLEVSGQRLNSTLAEKTSKVYAVDKRLFLSVQNRMPKVKVKFNDFPTSLRCGGIHKVSVTILNTGPSALKNLKLACSQPTAMCIPAHESNTSGTADCLEYKKVINIKLPDDKLEENASLTFDMWLRALNVPGSCSFNFIVYFEPVESVEDNYRQRCNRYSFTVISTEVMNVQAVTHQRSTCRSDQLGTHNVALLIHNSAPVVKGAITEVIITELLCMSKSWRICDSRTTEAALVNQSEVALLNTPIEYNQLPQDQVYDTSRVELNTVQYDQSVIHNFMCRQFWQKKQEEQKVSCGDIDTVLGVLWKSFTINEAGESVTSTGLYTLVLDVNKPIIPKLRGNSLLPNTLEFNAKSSSRQRANSQLRSSSNFEYDLRYPSRVKTNFSNNRLCIIPIAVILKSCSEELLKLQVSYKRTSDMTWSGIIANEFSLQPKSQQEFTVNVTVYRYGVYNLNNIQITSDGDVNGPIHQRDAALLIVEKG